ncbi:MAG: universal stress protein [Planctomyces sp.]|nr:universal stress protein [Planctomyces sp.]
MKRFCNILAAVDLAYGDQLVSPELSPPNREVVRQAVNLAAESGARLVLYTSLDVSEDTQKLVARQQGAPGSFYDQAIQILKSIADEAAHRNVKVEVAVGIGSGWERLIERVKDYQHDLVIAGARDRNPISRLLFGSTAMKLLRYCPCTVWIAKPRTDVGRTTILAAHDLTDVGHRALELAASYARLSHGQLLVLHAFETTPHHGRAGSDVEAAERKVLSNAAQEKLCDSISRLEDCPATELVIRNGRADHEISLLVEQRAVDIVFMGTRSRTGLGAMFIGNTAERLLPELNCSVIAVKPS